ncbi:MAG: recombinase RecT [Candidatus Peribacteraceae bacterium]|nr:recombinase RecT [Candidatus Peribacteraceae bacterium]
MTDIVLNEYETGQEPNPSDSIPQTNIVKSSIVTMALVDEYIDTFLSGKLNKEEKTKFKVVANAFNLNPFIREIYCVSYGSGNNRQLTLITGYEVYIKRAELSGRLDGWSVSTEGSIKGGNLKAVITIHRKDFKYPFIHEVYFNEYNQTRGVWKDKPITMLKKVAISQGFRLCFSTELAGIPYTSEEMPKGRRIEPDKIEDAVIVTNDDKAIGITPESGDPVIDVSFFNLETLLEQYSGNKEVLTNKWLEAANVKNLADLTIEQTQKCISYLETKLNT